MNVLITVSQDSEKIADWFRVFMPPDPGCKPTIKRWISNGDKFFVINHNWIVPSIPFDRIIAIRPSEGLAQILKQRLQPGGVMIVL